MRYVCELFDPNISAKYATCFTRYHTVGTGTLPLAPGVPAYYGDATDAITTTSINDMGITPDANGVFTMPKGTWEAVWQYVTDNWPAGDTLVVEYLVNGGVAKTDSIKQNNGPARVGSDFHFKSDGTATFAIRFASALGMTMLYNALSMKAHQ